MEDGFCNPTNGVIPCTDPCVATNPASALTYNNELVCAQYTMEEINNARAQLGESALTLPSNWLDLTPQEQVFVILNMERVSYGESPILGMNAALSTVAQTGAQNNADPIAASGFATQNGPGGGDWGSVWAQGSNALIADYLWMYDDTWGGSAATTSNIDCTSATAVGCWGHRDIILGYGGGLRGGVGTTCVTCEAGVGYAATDTGLSWTELIEVPEGSPPAMTFTWADELPYFSGEYSNYSIASPTGLTLTVLNFKRFPGRGDEVSLFVNWTLTTGAATTATFAIYKGSGCKNRVRSISDHYVLSEGGGDEGLFSTGGSRFFLPTVNYSARVSVTTPRGKLLGRCIVLGRGPDSPTNTGVVITH